MTENERAHSPFRLARCFRHVVDDDPGGLVFTGPRTLLFAAQAFYGAGGTGDPARGPLLGLKVHELLHTFVGPGVDAGRT